MKNNFVHIGTSGWSYGNWTGKFYPESIKSKDFLKFYGTQFSTVEVNSSFYHMLKEKTIVHWIDEVPEDFVFAVKADRYITHMKKLEDPADTVPAFTQSIKAFKHKLGPVLFQLPPSMDYNIERLDEFIKHLPKHYNYVLEFRNKNWFNDETYKLLKKHNIALCIYNLKGYQSPLEVTSGFVYIRMHGTMGIGSGKYSQEEIAKLSNNIEKFVEQNKTVYCYFNNDGNGDAIENAKELKTQLGLD